MRIIDQLGDQLSDTERRIATAMAEGKSTPEIAKTLGAHRSMVWRKAQQIRARAAGKG